MQQEQPPQPPQPQPQTTDWETFIHQQILPFIRQKILPYILLGTLLAYLYTEYLIPHFSIQAPEQYTLNSNSDPLKFYNALHLTPSANDAEIHAAYTSQLDALNQTSINITAMVMRAQLQEAYGVLSGGARCTYDFEILGLGFVRYFRCCWFRSRYP